MIFDQLSYRNTSLYCMLNIVNLAELVEKADIVFSRARRLTREQEEAVLTVLTKVILKSF